VIALLLGGCVADVEPPPPPPPPAPPAAPALPPPALAVVAGEHTWCRVSEGDLVECRGALTVSGRLPGELHVDDRALCGRADGRVRCLRALDETDEPTPFVQLVRGPGAPCGRTAEGEVFCFGRTDAREADAELVAVPLPGPARALASDGERLLALVGSTLYAFVPPAHGGGPPTVLAEGVTQLAGDDWTRACWLTDLALRCTTGTRRPVRGTHLGVGTGLGCVAGPDGVWCDGLEDADALGRAQVSSLAVGTNFACVVRAGAVSCAGQVPGAP